MHLICLKKKLLLFHSIFFSSRVLMFPFRNKKFLFPLNFNICFFCLFIFHISKFAKFWDVTSSKPTAAPISFLKTLGTIWIGSPILSRGLRRSSSNLDKGEVTLHGLPLLTNLLCIVKS